MVVLFVGSLQPDCRDDFYSLICAYMGLGCFHFPRAFKKDKAKVLALETQTVPERMLVMLLYLPCPKGTYRLGQKWVYSREYM